MRDPSHAFAERVRPFGAALLRYVRHCLRQPAEAEDVLQITLLRALESHDRFDPAIPFRVAIFRIATDEARNANRRGKRDRERNQDLDEAHDLEAPDVELEMVYERVLQDPDWVIPRLSDPVSRAVAELGDNQRAALVLRAVADLRCDDVAAILEAPKGTVLAWLHRARAHLRRRLAEHARSMGWKVGKAMNCRSAREYLQAYLDSELETAETLAVNRHLQVCDACRRRFQSEGRIEAAIAAQLRSGMDEDAAIFVQVLQRTLRRNAARRWRMVWWSAAAAALLLAVLFLTQQGGAGVPDLVETAAADHVKYRDGRMTPDLPATTTSEVRNYLESRLAVTCPSLPEQEGWRIVGPRMCRLKSIVVGLVLLAHDDQPISLFLLTPDKASDLGWAPDAKPRCYPLAEGHAVLAESQGTVLCAVGTAPLADLERLVTPGR